MDFFDFTLPPAMNIQTKFLGCKSCGHRMEWVVHSVSNIGLGMEKPNCRKCGSAETIEVDAYGR